MADDGEVLRNVWFSYLPIRFTLAADEVTSLQEPEPYYQMVSRLSYFPLVIDKVVKHFARFSLSHTSLDDLWLEFEGTPLKWHYPIGLLWDMHCADACLPWSLTVHFTRFPAAELVRCNTRAAIEAAFMSSVKEADALKHRSQVMTSLQKKDHNQLWQGVQNDKFDQFWNINRKLMATMTTTNDNNNGHSSSSSSSSSFRFIPFRAHLSPNTTTQRLIGPKLATGETTTVRHLYTLLFGGSDEDEEKEEEATATADHHHPPHHKYRLVLHGIHVPLDTPLQWLSEHMSYADNFLHFFVQRIDSLIET